MRIYNRPVHRKVLLSGLSMFLLLSGCSIQPTALQSAPQEASSASPAVTAAVSDAVAQTASPPNTPPEVADDELVRVLDYIPTLYVDLKYATTENFTGKVIYDFSEAQLRYGTVKKLAAVQDVLLQQGFSLKIWDAYRPVSAQFKLWSICPNATYVSDPNKGYSKHSRGNTVDVTMVEADGSEIEMPSGFDNFTARADRDYSDVSPAAKSNVQILENAMTSGDFKGYFGEWWHYSDNTDYPVIQD